MPNRTARAAAYFAALRGKTGMHLRAVVTGCAPGSRLAAAALLLALAACAGHNPAEPLTPFQIRERLVGHLVVATETDGRQLTMRFGPNGVATVTDGSAEFVHWRVSAAEGLCLQGFEGQSRCAPAYLVAPARLRWTDVTFSVLGYGTRVFEAPRPGLRPPPMRPR